MASFFDFLRLVGIKQQSLRKPAAKAKTRRSVRLGVESMEERAVPAVFAVTNNFDCGQGSLRQAILDSNANEGVDRIAFCLDSSNSVIRPNSALPELTDAAILDASGCNLGGRPSIEIDGSRAGVGASGLVLRSSGNVIRGLSITGFDRSGIEIHSSHNRIESNYLGLTREGLARGNGAHGVHLQGDAQFNTIGTNGDGCLDAFEGNFVAGNGRGVSLEGSNVRHNRVAGNKIGVNPNGGTAIGNEGAGDGVWTVLGASHNVIGTNGDGVSDALEGNEIAGHRWAGVALYNDGTNDNIVAGNAIRNNTWGVALQYAETNGPSYNRIGTNADGVSDAIERNTFSNNETGVLFAGPGVQGNTVFGNAFHAAGAQQSVAEIEGAASNPFGRAGIDGVRGNVTIPSAQLPPVCPIMVAPPLTSLPGWIATPRVIVAPMPACVIGNPEPTLTQPWIDATTSKSGFRPVYADFSRGVEQAKIPLMQVNPAVFIPSESDLAVVRKWAPSNTPQMVSMQSSPISRIIGQATRAARTFSLADRIAQLRR